MVQNSSKFSYVLTLLEKGEILKAAYQCLEFCSQAKESTELSDALLVLQENQTYADHEQLKILLLLNSYYKFKNYDVLGELKQYSLLSNFQWKPPIVILAGGTDKTVEKEMYAYQQLLIQSFRNFKGTIISGGTKAGIASLAGDLSQHYPTQMTCIGFLPSKAFTKDRAELDQSRYQKLVFSETAQKFDLQPVLQYWIELAVNTIDKANIKLLGINGGQISAFEYRFALINGIDVGLIAGSGREADKLIKDEYWCSVNNLKIMINQDQNSLTNFINN